MTIPVASTEKILIERIKSGDKTAFTIIFTWYYQDLVRFSGTFTHNSDVSEELVQEVFVNFWEDRDSLVIETSLKSYLLKTVQNRSLDWLRHLKVRNKYASQILEKPILFENNTENYVLYSELELSFSLAVKKLPDQYAEVYKMSRVELLTYQEISTKLGVSVRTVEVRVSKALSILREELKDYLLLIVFILHLFL
jgi:RNA polymerase sigma-70 factor (ECF subfamily)